MAKKVLKISLFGPGESTVPTKSSVVVEDNRRRKSRVDLIPDPTIYRTEYLLHVGMYVGYVLGIHLFAQYH